MTTTLLTTRRLYAAVFFVMGEFFFYLLFSASALSPNPLHWEAWMRLLFILLTIGLFVNQTQPANAYRTLLEKH